MNTNTSTLFFFLLSLLCLSSSFAKKPQASSGSTILFTTLGRPTFEFDLFTLPTSHRPPSPSDEHRITAGKSIHFNGHFASPSPALISLIPKNSGIHSQDPSLLHLIYVTERYGAPTLSYDVVQADYSKTSAQVPLLPELQSGMTVNSMKDTPVLTNEHLVYVSTHEEPGKPKASWAAVYSTELRTRSTRRLTPYGIADFSPAVSPSGKWTAVASFGEKGWIWSFVEKEIGTDIYVFLTRDGTQRVKVVEQGGWPRWVDESTLYFHRKSDDGWISVYRAILPKSGPVSTKSVTVQRVTPPGIHAFTPATSPNNNNFIAVATRRPGTEIRHVELFDLKKNEFVELTRLVSPKSHHFNPFLSPDSSRVGYHSCRGDATGRNAPRNLLQNLKTTSKDLSLFRFDGAFPSLSPQGDRFAFVTNTGVYVVNLDGSGRRQLLPQMGFGTVWDPVRSGIVYTSSGPALIPGKSQIDILAINVDAPDPSTAVRNLTTTGQNNAFPWPSPDGKRIVFRSARSGTKNLYIMDAEKGETGGLFRLTNGNWSDVIATWSPDGNWIVFASNREFPGTLLMNLYVVHPDGTGLRKVAQNLTGAVSMHPMFSPDSKRIVFTTTYAAISAESIGNPHFNVPSSEIFTVNLDGSDFTRLTHNSLEDGPPMWFPKIKATGDVAWPKRFGPSCDLEDFKPQNTTVKMNRRQMMCVPSQ
ncbi:hypothetical protein EUTSA_v10006965mg [Eutrema salsugineum]|uniref:Uncharacterized protein n=1 Tax=Eutrema salsugineum TaxID=72664 RepID=V4MS60_EUTSA|nr:uncharacterized protein LOC18992778 [Eutrema salsugineum]ESQ34631.1 hypothetical protein EUTSA_v10006965mg [Eutrema salsugineum]